MKRQILDSYLKTKFCNGLILDSSDTHIKTIKSKNYYWKYNLKAINTFVTKKY